MVLTFSSLALATTLGGGYAWAQGGFDASGVSADLAPVARTAAPVVTPGDPQAPTGYGVLGSSAPLMGPHVVPLSRAAGDPTDSDAAPSSARATSAAPTGKATGASTSGQAGTSASSTVATGGAGAGALAGGAGSLVPGSASTVPPTTGTTSAGSAGSTGSAGVPAPGAGTTPVPSAAATTPAATVAPVASSGPAGGGPSFGLATFNLLGSSHTPPGGTRASGPPRAGGGRQVGAPHGESGVGVQEMATDPHVAIESLATGWQSYPSTATSRRPKQDTVAWRTDTWSLVSARTVLSPAWLGTLQPMPYVLLRHRATGRTVYVSTFHNTVGKLPRDQASREEATRRQVALVQQLAATGVPQLLTGDMNERDTWFCRITALTGLRSATGGTNDATGCHPSRPSGIDWILGSTGIRFTGTQRDRSALVRATTDHPVLVTRVSLPR